MKWVRIVVLVALVGGLGIALTTRRERPAAEAPAPVASAH